MRLINSHIKIYLSILKQSFVCFSKNPLLMYLGVIYIVFLFAAQILSQYMLLFGYMLWIAALSACLSSYLYVINKASYNLQFDWSDVRQGVSVYFRNIMGLLLLDTLILYFIGIINSSLILFLIYRLVVFVILNALPEVLSNQHDDVFGIITATVQFERKHALAWFLPVILLIIPYLAWSAFQQMIIRPLLFSGVFDISMTRAIMIVIGLIIVQFALAIILIFRQILYRKIESGKTKPSLKVVK